MSEQDLKPCPDPDCRSDDRVLDTSFKETIIVCGECGIELPESVWNRLPREENECYICEERIEGKVKHRHCEYGI